ncbi:hypothetical protein NKJ71_32490 [Mesorhizobium sp. M0050]|uniref:hypothetical protein n=1 Tax=Mesorhizobium sp. M0050 TaxID=2956861 RepID=UPI00333DC351
MLFENLVRIIIAWAIVRSSSNRTRGRIDGEINCRTVHPSLSRDRGQDSAIALGREIVRQVDREA